MKCIIITGLFVKFYKPRFLFYRCTCMKGHRSVISLSNSTTTTVFLVFNHTPPPFFYLSLIQFYSNICDVILHFYSILINKFSFVWITVKTQKCIIWTIQEIFIVNVSPQACLPPLSDSYMEASNVELSLGSWILAISKLFISSVLNLLHSAFKQWTRRNQFTQHLRRATSLWCLVRVPMVQPATLHH